MQGAPKGNQFGVGYGSPPNEGFADEDLHTLGRELVDWCKQTDSDKREVVHLSEWYSEVKSICPSQWKSIIRRDSFRDYYEIAMHWMGKRILKNTKMPTAYGSRFLGIYFKEVSEHEREIVEHKIDYEIKKKLESARSDPTIHAEQKEFIDRLFVLVSSASKGEAKKESRSDSQAGKELPQEDADKLQS